MPLALHEMHLNEVDDYLATQHPGHGQVKAVTLHHCFHPNQSEYRGESTMLGIQRFQMNRPDDISDIMANLYVTPLGTVWTARPLSWKNWAHAYVNKPWSQVEDEAEEVAYPNRQFFNSFSIGIEMMADFDREPVDPAPPVLIAVIDVICTICNRYGFGPESVFFHRDVSAKSCPGKNLDRGWVRRQVAEQLGTYQQVKVILRPGQLVGTLSLPRGGEIKLPHDFDHRDDQSKMYIDQIS